MKACRMKSYQFLKIYKRFYKDREKTLIQQSMRKKTEKSWTLLYNRLFYKALKNDNYFFFNKSFCLQDFFLFRKLVHSVVFSF